MGIKWIYEVCGGGRLDKTVLQEYIDACELVKDIEAEIQKLNRKRSSRRT